MIISKDTNHCEFLLKNSLGISLQYIVRTDFELFRRRVDPTRTAMKHRRHPSSSSLPSSPIPASLSSARSLSSSQSSIRTHTSSSSRHNQSPSRRGNYTVNLVRDSIHQVISSKSIEDINFKMTRLVILIYENVLKLGIHVIGDIVSSGLISGLLFRVGKGENIEKRFFKLVNHFIYLLLIKLSLTLDSSERSMAVTDIAPPEVYTRGGNKSSDIEELRSLPGTSQSMRRKYTSSSMSSPSNPSSSLSSRAVSPAAPSTASSSSPFHVNITNKLVKEQSEPITMRTVTKKLHVQGVTELLISSLDSDDYDVIRDSLISLASLHFSTIKSLIIVEKVIGRITAYTHTRKDCFYSGLALIVDVRPLPTPLFSLTSALLGN